MPLTRREFLGYTAGAAGLIGSPAWPAPVKSKLDRWRVFAPSNRVNSEAFRGYAGTLPKHRQRLSPDEADSISRCSLVIVPDVAMLDPAFGRALGQALDRGASVVVETGIGFATHETFRRHRRCLHETLGVRVAAPVDLWTHPSRPPYVELTWPRRALIRDFSRVVPPVDQPGEIIACAGDLAVAFRRRVGKGTLIYLGSPVGPALWAGDVEAKRWLYAVALAA